MANAGQISEAVYNREVIRLRQNDQSKLAPKFRDAVEAAVAECLEAGHDVVVFECLRSDELAKLYFEHGVSKARTARLTWHHYGLAVDVISKSKGWSVYPNEKGEGGDTAWYQGVAEIFKKHGLDWGGDWHSIKDWPHWQWGLLKATPSERAMELYDSGGCEAVWEEVGAAA